jgi:hypothetical protein
MPSSAHNFKDIFDIKWCLVLTPRTLVVSLFAKKFCKIDK